MKFRQLSHEEITATRQTFPLRLILETVQVPDNVGMIFRLAEAFGVERLYLTGDCIAPPNIKISKASRRTVREVDFEIETDTAAVIGQLKAEGFTVIGLEVAAGSSDLRHFDFEKFEKIALVVGGEKYGISAGTLALFDACVKIELFGKTSSLNVATALAIALHSATVSFLR